MTESLTTNELLELTSYLTPLEQDELNRLTAAVPLKIWSPWPGRPQETAYHSQADVLGFGGSGGGGKTDLILGLALTQHRRSIIFRREAAQSGAIIERAREIIGTTKGLNQNTGMWRGLPGDRQIEFAGVKDLGDEQKFRGRPHDLIGFDEADQFHESQVRFLQGWLRTTIPNQRCRVVLTFNPPPNGSPGRWLLEFFKPWLAYLHPGHFAHPRPAAPGELRWYAMLPDGTEVERDGPEPFQHGDRTVTPRSRTFILSRVFDNPALMASGYDLTLQSLPEPLRSQLLYGDFAADQEDDVWQVIPTAWIKAAQDRWREDGKPDRPITTLGLDVARGGSDKTVIAPRYGTWYDRLVKYPGKLTPDGPTVALRVLDALDIGNRPANNEAAIAVDVIGLGASAYDCCILKGLDAYPINFGQTLSGVVDRSGKLEFFNVRAKMYWRFREALDPHSGDGIALPPDPELLADLAAAKWQLRTGKILIEAKDEIVKRIGRSPDCGDAVVLAHYDAIAAAGPGPKAAATRRKY